MLKLESQCTCQVPCKDIQVLVAEQHSRTWSLTGSVLIVEQVCQVDYIDSI